MDTDMLGGRKLKAALRMRPMIDANIQPLALKLAIGNALPRLPDIAKLHVGCRHAIRQQPRILVLKIGLFSQPGFTDLPRGHHHMRMVVSDIALLVRRMDRQIYRCAIAVRQILSEGLCCLQPPFGRKLMR